MAQFSLPMIWLFYHQPSQPEAWEQDCWLMQHPQVHLMGHKAEERGVESKSEGQQTENQPNAFSHFGTTWLYNILKYLNF